MIPDTYDKGLQEGPIVHEGWRADYRADVEAEVSQ